MLDHPDTQPNTCAAGHAEERESRAYCRQAPNGSQYRCLSASRSNCKMRLPSLLVWILHVRSTGAGPTFLKWADEPNVVLKMTIQDRPQKGAQPFHGDKIHLRRWTRSVLDSQPLVPFPMSWVAMGFKAGRSCRRGPRLAQPQGHLAAGQDKSC